METKTVMLLPNQSQQVTFSVEPIEPGHHTVIIDGLTGGFLVEEWPDVDFLSLDKETLHSYLVSGVVGRAWWGLADTYRRSLGLKITSWFGSFGYIAVMSRGEPNCQQAGETNEEAFSCVTSFAACVGNAIIRLALFGDGSYVPSDIYYLYYPCFRCLAGEHYHLPVKPASVPGHTITALQVGLNQADFDSWIFFQYSNSNIQPGDWQMPSGEHLLVMEVTRVDLSVGCTPGIAHDGEIAEWIVP